MLDSISAPYIVIGLILIILGAIVSILEHRRGYFVRLLDVVLLAVLVAFAGLRAQSLDYADYVIMFESIRDSTSGQFLDRIMIGKDLLFGALIAALAELGLGQISLFVSAALLSVGIKFVAFRMAFGSAALGLIIYFFTYYFLHDFTQIRAAISIGFCFCCLVFLARGKVREFLIAAPLAVGFHSQAALFVAVTLPLVFGFERGLKWMLLISTALVGLAPILMRLVVAYADRPGIGLGEEAASTNLVLANIVNTALLGAAYLGSRSHIKTTFEIKIASASMILVLTGLLFLLGTYEVSMTLGSRASEMFMCFGVFVMVAAIRAPSSPVAWVACLGYVLFNIVLFVRGPLLVEYNLTEGLL